MRWGFLGASKIGASALAPAILQAGHTLHAVGARDIARARAFADRFAAPRAYGSYAELIADPDIDAVYNALTNEAHVPWSIAALQAGKHVLCEKPLAINAAEVEALQRAEHASGRRAMEAFCHVFHPQIARLTNIISGGEIGDLVAIHTWFGGNFTFDPAEFHWIPERGGGALYDLGCYCVSLTRVLAGSEPHRIQSTQTLRNGVDATLTGLLQFPGELTASLTCSFDAPRTQQMTILARRGRVQLDWPFSTKGRATRLDFGDRVETFEPMDPYVAMVAHFARATEGAEPMRYDLGWSLGQARVLDGLRGVANESVMTSDV
jgi:xylose dehydrogenase (NAD/NADP)